MSRHRFRSLTLSCLTLVLILAFHWSFNNDWTLCSSKSKARGPGQKVISYSFFGATEKCEKYKKGLQLNIELVPKFYPDFIIRIYHDENQTLFLTQNYGNFSHVDLCPAKEISFMNIEAEKIVPTTWRFFPIFDPFVEEFHSRDLDSLPSQRELDAVQEFRARQQTQFHIMRDHKYHSAPIMAGMWGAKPTLNLKFARDIMLGLMQNADKDSNHGKDTDQVLLAKHIFPHLKGRVLAHDSYNCGQLYINETKGFPSRRQETEPLNFVGAVEDEKALPILVICPPPCRPMDHKDWLYC